MYIEYNPVYTVVTKIIFSLLLISFKHKSPYSSRLGHVDELRLFESLKTY